jgi:tetratricopeptide (TPR) repeat protein
MMVTRRPIFRPIVLLLLILVTASTVSLASDPNWSMVTSSHFYVLSDDGEIGPRRVALHLEQMRMIFAQLLSRDKISTSEPLDVMALRGDEYAKVAPLQDGGRAATLGGFFIAGDDRNYIVINTSQQDGWRAVAYDYARTLLNFNYPPTQPWFDEGFAQYFASLKMGAKEGELGGDPDGSFVPVLTSSTWVPVAELFADKTATKPCNSDPRQRLFCAESWMVMHYLINNQRLPDVGSYLNSVMIQKLPIGEAIEKAFGMNAAQLQKSVQDYFRVHTQPTAPGSTANSTLAHPIPLPIAEIGFGSTLQQVEKTRAESLVAEMMVRLPGRRDEAVKEINFLMNGEKTENSVQHRALAWMYIQEKDYPRALEELKAASEIKINDAWVLYYSSLMKYREAQASGKEYRGLENMFQEMRAVIDWNPEFAEAYNMLAMARLDGGGINSAIAAIREAVRLAPRNQTYVLHLAEIYMAAKKWDDANALLEQLKAGDDASVAHAAVTDLNNLPYLKKYGVLPQDQTEADKNAVYSQDPDADTGPDEPAEPAKPKLDTRPIKFVKGTLLSVDCSKAPEATLQVLAAGRKMLFRASEYKSMVVVGAEQTSCDWKDIHVAINYKPSGARSGDVVSLELE